MLDVKAEVDIVVFASLKSSSNLRHCKVLLASRLQSAPPESSHGDNGINNSHSIATRLDNNSGLFLYLRQPPQFGDVIRLFLALFHEAHGSELAQPAVEVHQRRSLV